MRILLLLACFLATHATAAHARPVGYAQSVMAMTMNDGMEHSALMGYSPTATDYAGLRADYLREDEAWMTTVNYNRLLKRWNAPGSQGNLFFLGGVGEAFRSDDQSAAAWAGMEADWENRRYYVAYENRVIAASAIDEQFMQRARIGIAPYIGDYDDVHGWLMLQVDHRPRNHEQIMVTPLVRLFTTEVLGEVGISTRGDVLFNLTTQF